MREVLNMTEGLRRLMLTYVRGYSVWISFQTEEERVVSKALQWERDYGTRLLAYQRQDLKERGQPTAVATSMLVLGSPSLREVFLMATPLALSAPKASPWATQKWQERPLRCGIYIMVRSPRPRGDYAWTWNLQADVVSRLASRLTYLVKSGNEFSIRVEINSWVSTFSMFRGVRQQLTRLLKSAQKLWHACHRINWPAISPESLPFITEFKSHVVRKS